MTDMEVDNVTHNLQVWFLPGLSKVRGRFHLRQIDFTVVTVNQLKQLIIDEERKQGTSSGESILSSISDIDLLYNGNIMKVGVSTLDSQKIKPDAVITVVRNFIGREASASGVSHEKPSPEHIKEMVMALRTAFLSPTFLKTIEKLSDPEMLRNIIAIAPGLETDLTGIAIIQNPHMIFQLCERESLARLTEKRPWVLEALNHVAAAIHAEKGSKPSRVPGNMMLSQLLNTAFDGEGEDEMEEEEEATPSRTQSQPNLHGPITREQLTQALNAVPMFGSEAVSGRGAVSPGGAFANFLNPSASTSSSRPATAPPTASPVTGNPNFQQLLQNALASIAHTQNQNSGGETPPQVDLQNLLQRASTSTNLTGSEGSIEQVLTPDLVSRAINQAINQLPPDERSRQFDMFRQLASQIASGIPCANPQTPDAATSSTGVTVARDYQQQLSQIRELGITDTRLSLLALRVSGGDVETAAELIFSGWDGSGADSEGST